MSKKVKVKYIYDKTGVNCIRTGVWRLNDTKELSVKEANILLDQYPGWFEIVSEEKKEETKPANLKSSKTK